MTDVSNYHLLFKHIWSNSGHFERILSILIKRASVFQLHEHQTIIPQSYITEFCWGMKNFFNLIWDSSYTGIVSNFNIVSLRNIIVIYLVVLSFRPETMCCCDDPFTIDDWPSAMTLKCVTVFKYRRQRKCIETFMNKIFRWTRDAGLHDRNKVPCGLSYVALLHPMQTFTKCWKNKLKKNPVNQWPQF